MTKAKTAVVTGSTSGIGLGIAKALAAEGVSIMMNGIEDEKTLRKFAKISKTSLALRRTI